MSLCLKMSLVLIFKHVLCGLFHKPSDCFGGVELDLDPDHDAKYMTVAADARKNMECCNLFGMAMVLRRIKRMLRKPFSSGTQVPK